MIELEIAQARRDADAFLRAREFLRALKKCSQHLSWQEYKTLRWQALSGDIAGAVKGLDKIMRR